MKNDFLKFLFQLFKVLCYLLLVLGCGYGLRYLEVFSEVYHGMLVAAACFVAVEIVAIRLLIEDWKDQFKGLGGMFGGEDKG